MVTVESIAYMVAKGIAARYATKGGAQNGPANERTTPITVSYEN